MASLLLIAKARDDWEIRARLAAALAIQAQIEVEKTNPAPSDNSKMLSEFVIVNPLSLVDRAFNILASVPALTDKIKMVGDKIDCNDILDTEIQAGVAGKWTWLSDYLGDRNII